jgi:hypothetical protein
MNINTHALELLRHYYGIFRTKFQVKIQSELWLVLVTALSVVVIA